jgi:class 3 adenylate cyclase/tetratricopeptide (TPR) repeat protein
MRFCGNCASPLVSPHASVERRVVTVLFADVVAFAHLSSIVDAEHLREQIGGFFGLAREEIERCGGTIEKYIGDAVMAVFGLPVIRENDPERAVQAAWGMLRRTHTYITAGVIPDIRVGIATGEVVADARAAGKGEFMITGEVVVLAARLQQHGQPGKILVDESTHEATRHLFDYQRAAALQVKGRPDPVIAYVCLSPRRHPATRRGLPGIASPLVAREHEFVALVNSVEQVLAGHGGIVGVIGDAGLGKSRLLAEANRAFGGRDMIWLEGRALSYSKSISYWPFLEILHAAAGITEADSEAESWGKLETLVGAVLANRAEEVTPYLGVLLGLEVPEPWRERVMYLDGEAMGRQIYRSMRLFFERQARVRPTVMIIEDLQWLDDSSVALLEHLFPLVRQVPVLFCGLSRPDTSVPAARLRMLARRDYADRYTEIVLLPLDADAGKELIRNLLQTSELPDTILQTVLHRAEGNPFFAEEIIRTLIHTGAIERDVTTDRLLMPAAVGRIAIPDTLRGVIMARVDQLDELDRQLLKTASVIGRSFHYRILRAMVEDERLDSRLDALIELELIRERRRVPELEYIFKHALIQEAVYESILLRERGVLHRKAGTAIEMVFGDRLEEFYGVLAYHFAHAEDWEKAQAYLFKAGDQSGKMAADVEALAHYEQALTAYAHAFGNTWDPLQRAGFERKVAEALFRRGEHQQAMQHLLRALAHLHCPIPSSRRAVRRAIAKEAARQAAHRLLPGVVSARRPPGSDAVAEERCHIYEAMGWIDYFTHVERVLLESLLVLNLAERHGFLTWQAVGSYGLGLIASLLNLPRLARFYLLRGEVMLGHFRHPLVHGGVYLGLGFYELHLGGRWQMALNNFDRSAIWFREGGELRRWGASATMAAWTHRLMGQYTESLDQSQELVRVGVDTGDPEVHGWGLAQLGATHWQLGHLEQGASYLRQAVELFRAVGDDLWIYIASCDLARLSLLLGRFDEGVALADEGAALASQRGYLGFDRSFSQMAQMETMLALAERAEPTVQREAFRNADYACALALRQSKVDHTVKPGAYRLCGTLQWLRGRRALAQRWWQKSLASAEALGAPYELGLTYLEIGRRTGANQPLQQARSIFAHLGAEWGVSQVHHYLAGPGESSSADLAGDRIGSQTGAPGGTRVRQTAHPTRASASGPTAETTEAHDGANERR